MSLNISEYVKAALQEFQAEAIDSWGNEQSCILMGLAKLAESTKEEADKTALYNLLEQTAGHKFAGIGACYGYDFTREDKYRNEMCARMEALKGELDTEADEMALVFYMKYETKLGGKEHYQDVVSRFKRAVENENKDAAYCMVALIEAIESIDQAIYEYYDDLKRLFKKCMAEALDAEEMDSTQMAMVGYAILKACRMKVILAEKYEELGQELVEDTFAASESADMNMGACIMAYAESLLHK